MKEFEKSVISLRIEEKEQQLQELKATMEKIKKFDKEVEVQAIVGVCLYRKVSTK